MKKVASVFMICLLAVLIPSCREVEKKENPLDKQLKVLSKMAELGTVEYTITKILKVNDNKVFYKLGERKILFAYTAFMKAGIDLENFSKENIQVDKEKNSVKVTLPKAQLLAFNMPPEKIRVVYKRISGFRDDFSVEERNELLRQGEENIIADVDNIGILKEAEQNAKSFFETLLSQCGFTDVNVVFKNKGIRSIISKKVIELKNQQSEYVNTY